MHRNNFWLSLLRRRVLRGGRRSADNWADQRETASQRGRLHFPVLKPPSRTTPEGQSRSASKVSTLENEKRIGEAQSVVWTEEDDKKLFALYKEKGSTWSAIAKEFEGRNENQVKNRFYSTLRRVATKRSRENPDLAPRNPGKNDLLQYVDEAIEYGHNCFTKRGRRKKCCVEIRRETRPASQSSRVPAVTTQLPPAPVSVLPPLLSQAQPQQRPALLQLQAPCFPYGSYAMPSYPQLSQVYVPSGYGMGVPAIGQPEAMMYNPGPTVNIQAQLEELTNLQRSIINLLLHKSSGASAFTDFSTCNLK